MQRHWRGELVWQICDQGTLVGESERADEVGVKKGSAGHIGVGAEKYGVVRHDEK